ncbi:uncharacterized protein LOC142165038 [Nicotiana tabacum]|uniref:Uncharacterized protein LOC142165038 n=1 Tax=Nicotiana tabacum TaxID=4097 RepID=A0AC58S477_TOBAC
MGFQMERTPYNPQSKYVTIPDNWLCIHCGNNRHFKENFQARVQSLQKNKAFVEKVTTKRGPDHGTEFDNAKFDEFYNENGITHNFSAPRTSQQNGVVEKNIRTLEEMARTMLIDSGIAKNFWAEAVNTACYLKRNKDDQDGEPLLVPGEVIDMTNGKADMMSQVKEPSKDNAVSSSPVGEEPGTINTTTKVEERVVDAVKSTPQVAERRMQGNQSDLPSSSTNKIKVPNWKHKSSHPLDNIITPLDSAFLSQIESKNIKEALKDADWITAMQDELHQLERNNVWHLAVKVPLTKWFYKKENRQHLVPEETGEKPVHRSVKQSTKGTYICQQKYIKELLKRLDMEASKVIDTLIVTATRLDMDESGSSMNQTMYRGIIGSLLYLTASRPDIVFSMGLCNLVDRKSASRMAHFLGSCLISWGTRKQNAMALSTTKAEYVAAASCCAQLLWIKQQLEDFCVYIDCVPLLCDNTNALNMAKNPVQHKRTKHVDVRHHFLRDNVEKGLIYMKFCSTEDQIADIFTKALSREHFERNRLELGLIKPN